MPAPKYRSRTKRRVFVRTPGSAVKLHYRDRKPQPACCPVTGEVLQGVPRASVAELRNMPKTCKRPERPFGGVLSSRAMRRFIVEEARSTDVLE